MRPKVIFDTGPLVAFLSEQDVYQEWVIQELAKLPSPLLTCEAVLTETCFLLRKHAKAPAPEVLKMVRQGFILVPFRLQEEIEKVERLMIKYANVPMSLADACLVRMSEQYSNSVILTLDSDFRIYRKFGNQPIPVIMPEIQ